MCGTSVSTSPTTSWSDTAWTTPRSTEPRLRRETLAVGVRGPRVGEDRFRATGSGAGRSRAAFWSTEVGVVYSRWSPVHRGEIRGPCISNAGAVVQRAPNSNACARLGCFERAIPGVEGRRRSGPQRLELCTAVGVRYIGERSAGRVSPTPVRLSNVCLTPTLARGRHARRGFLAA